MTTDAPSTPPAEINITLDLIRDLLKAQHPDLADLSVKIMESGWDNLMVRLGDDLALRLPRHAVGDRLLRIEQQWLPALAPHLPLPIPVTLRIGSPDEHYPFHWSIVKWLPGQTADLTPPAASEAPQLASFLKALHAIGLPSDPPGNSVRDCPLTGKQKDTEKRLDFLARETDLISPEVLATWHAGLTAEIDLPTCWIAGDIHGQNVLVEQGKLSAIIDWGDMCAGDPATDLASIWILFEDQTARQHAIAEYGMSGPTIVRAKGWATFFGAILTETGMQDNPQHQAMGTKVLERLHQDG